jgi:hypothetical protein
MATDEEPLDLLDVANGRALRSRKGKEKVDRPEWCRTPAGDAQRQGGPTVPSSPSLLGGGYPVVTDGEQSTRANGAGIESSQDDGPSRSVQQTPSMTASSSTISYTRRIGNEQTQVQGTLPNPFVTQDNAPASFSTDYGESSAPRAYRGGPLPGISSFSRLSSLESLELFHDSVLGQYLMPGPGNISDSLHLMPGPGNIWDSHQDNHPVHGRNPDYTRAPADPVDGPLPHPGRLTELLYSQHPNLPVPYDRPSVDAEILATNDLLSALEWAQLDSGWPHRRNFGIPVIHVDPPGPGNPLHAYEHARGEQFRIAASQYLHGSNVVEGRQYGFGTTNAEVGANGPPRAGTMRSSTRAEFGGPVVPDGQGAGETEERLRMPHRINSGDARNGFQTYAPNLGYQSSRQQDGQPGPSQQPVQSHPASPNQWNGRPDLPHYQAQRGEESYLKRYSVPYLTPQSHQRHISNQGQQNWRPVLPSVIPPTSAPMARGYSQDSGYVGSGNLNRPGPSSFQSPGAPIYFQV